MKQIILTHDAPLPIGPYSQAVKHGSMLYISGQLPINPITNKVVYSTIEKETECVMQNIEAILKAAEMTFENVVQVTILLKDINDFEAVNKVYATYFNSRTAPARVTLQASLLKNVNIMMTMIAGE